MNYFFRLLSILSIVTLAACANTQTIDLPNEGNTDPQGAEDIEDITIAVEEIPEPEVSVVEEEALIEENLQPEPLVETPEPQEFVEEVREMTSSESDFLSTAMAALLSQNIYYFDYDKAELREEAFDSLDAHINVIQDMLVDDPDLLITIEGHTDERGTVEYNIALSLRRAEAIGSYLQRSAIPAENISTVGFGESKPVELSSDEWSWSRNRRAVLRY